MIKFSFSTQSFYDDSLNYAELPADLIEVYIDQYYALLNQINSGCIIFSDLTASSPRPDQFHTWNGTNWIDERTPQEIADYNRSLLPKLPKRQFALYLYDHQLYDQVMSTLDQNPRFKIEYETVKDLERMSPTVLAMTALLGWTDQQVEIMWNEALML